MIGNVWLFSEEMVKGAIQCPWHLRYSRNSQNFWPNNNMLKRYIVHKTISHEEPWNLFLFSQLNPSDLVSVGTIFVCSWFFLLQPFVRPWSFSPPFLDLLGSFLNMFWRPPQRPRWNASIFAKYQLDLVAAISFCPIGRPDIPPLIFCPSALSWWYLWHLATTKKQNLNETSVPLLCYSKCRKKECTPSIIFAG